MMNTCEEAYNLWAELDPTWYEAATVFRAGWEARQHEIGVMGDGIDGLQAVNDDLREQIRNLQSMMVYAKRS